MSKIITGLLIASLSLPPLMVDKYMRPETVPVKVEKVVPAPPVKLQTQHYNPKGNFCVQVRQRVDQFGKDTVLAGAHARSMSQTKIDAIIKDCKVK